MADIKKELNDIKNAVYGREVRSSIHDGIKKINEESEESKQKAEEAYEITQDLLDETFDSAALEANFEQRLNDEIANLQPEWTGFKNDVTAQLAQTALGLLPLANATKKLGIINYLGNNQNIHPKVVYFENGWNGYKYWMAYTPYPNGDTTAENPCIAVSNDMINWTVPQGLTNPLDPTPAQGYNSDTHLLYREDTNTLEIWWRQYYADNDRRFYRRTTQDGVNWTPKELIFTANYYSEMFSPAVMFDEGKYKIWFVRRRDPNRGDDYVMYRESVGDTVTQWHDEVALPIDWDTDNIAPWHIDVEKTNLGYEMLVCGGDRTKADGRYNLWHVIQRFDGTFTKPVRVLSPGEPGSIDENRIYRSCMIKVDGKYHVFYSYRNNDGVWGMSLTSGESIIGLHGQRNDGNLKTVDIQGGETLSDYNVNGIDVLRLRLLQANQDITINSFVGGYLGKKITLVAYGSNSKAIIHPTSGRMLLPNGYNKLEIDYSHTISVELICTNPNGDEWRVVGSGLYEEGSWTPTLAFTSVAGNHDYSEQVGHYVRLGNMVTVFGRIKLNSLDPDAEGATAIAGLPYPVRSNNVGTGAISYWQGIDLSGFDTLGLTALRINRALLQRNRTTSATTVPANLVSDNFEINFSLTYLT